MKILSFNAANLKWKHLFVLFYVMKIKRIAKLKHQSNKRKNKFAQTKFKRQKIKKIIRRKQRTIKSNISKCKKKRGRGIVNTLINKLPFELHIPHVSV